MKSQYDLIIFDLDGTLLDTAGEITDSANAALAELKLPQVSLEQTRGWVGQGAQHFWQVVLEAVNVKADEEPYAKKGFELFMKHYERLSGTNSQLYPFVKEGLDALQSQGVKMAVLTNKVKVNSDITLQAHGLTAYFSAVLGGDSLPEKKPSPVGVHWLVEQLGVDTKRTLFVGDSSTDVKTARNAGVSVWALPYGYNHGRPIEEAEPDRVIANFSVFL